MLFINLILFERIFIKAYDKLKKGVLCPRNKATKRIEVMIL